MIFVRVISIVLGLPGAARPRRRRWCVARRATLPAAARCCERGTVARGSLEAAEAEQVRQVAALRQAGEQRAREAAQAVEQGRQQVAEQHAAAQHLLGQRTAGEQCAAVEAVIDQELGR